MQRKGTQSAVLANSTDLDPRAHTYQQCMHAAGAAAHTLVCRLLCGLLVHWAPDVRASAATAAQRVTSASSALLEPLLDALRGCMNQPSSVAPLVVVGASLSAAVCSKVTMKQQRKKRSLAAWLLEK